MPWRGPDETRAFPSLGGRVVEFIETYLCHGPGDVMGDPIELDDEFYEFVIRAYCLDPDTGRRVYRRAVLVPGEGPGEVGARRDAGGCRGPGPGAVRRLGRRR